MRIPKKSKLTETDWQLIYPGDDENQVAAVSEKEPQGSPEAASRSRSSRSIRGRVTLTPIAAKRLTDNVIFRIGDIVLLENNFSQPFVGMIHKFEFNMIENVMEARTIWFQRPLDIKKPRNRHPEGFAENEIYITCDEDKNELNVIKAHARVYSEAALDKAFPKGIPKKDQGSVFVCKRAINTTTFYYSQDIIWEDITKKITLKSPTTTEDTVNELLQLITKLSYPSKVHKGRGKPAKDNNVKPKAKAEVITNKDHSGGEDDDKSVIVYSESEASIEEQDSLSESEIESDIDSSDDEFRATHLDTTDVPRKRGRPRKNAQTPVISDDEDVLDDDDDKPRQKRPKGRPRKQRTAEEEEAERAKIARREERQRRKELGLAPIRQTRTPGGPSTPRKQRRKINDDDDDDSDNNLDNDPNLSPSKRMIVRAPLAVSGLPQRMKAATSNGTISPHKLARISLHVSSVPDSLPCRDQEFSDIYIALEGAITEAQGSCIYISGTPGTGKTATVREVVAQLQLRSEDGELRDFSFLEINGMKLANPHAAYEQLWEEISGGQRVSASNAVVLLENEFKRAKQSRTPLVILMDELDQLVTQNQGVMYNFFNWPTYHHSRLIVVALANTMDLPERTLSNKISSRLGLTRFQFPGYTHDQLKIIIESRLASITQGGEGKSIMDKSAIEFAARKVASVSGDARRALDICRRAVELAEPKENDDNDNKETNTGQVTIAHIQAAIIESTTSPTYTYLKSAPLSVKIVLCALVNRLRRVGVADASLRDILEDCERLVKVSHTNANTARVSALLFNNNNNKDTGANTTNTISKAIMAGVNHKKVRMNGFTHAVAELVQSGIIIQQATKGEITANVRLNIGDGEVLSAFKNDADVAGML